MRDGRLTFARYALMPNRLGYCGGPEDRELLEYATADVADDGMNPLIRQFQAAYPYLCFIAESSGVGNPFDPRVVESYWIGSELLDRVDPLEFDGYLREKVVRRIPKRLQKYVVGKVPAGARPHHSFHVFDVSMKAGALPEQVEALDQCRISWGVVQNVTGDAVSVRYQPVVLIDGKLALGETSVREARRTAEGKGYLNDLQTGDVVSMHWGWICDRLSMEQATRLSAETRHHIEIANATI